MKNKCIISFIKRVECNQSEETHKKILKVNIETSIAHQVHCTRWALSWECVAQKLMHGHVTWIHVHFWLPPWIRFITHIKHNIFTSVIVLCVCSCSDCHQAPAVLFVWILDHAAWIPVGDGVANRHSNIQNKHHADVCWWVLHPIEELTPFSHNIF